MSELNVYDKSGAVVGTVQIEKSLLEVPERAQLVHDVVVAYQANQRSGSANTKTRNEVSASTAKPWRQKGTGRARSGMRSSPIWRGGGTVFGPKPRDYSKKVSKKAKRMALQSVISDCLSQNNIIVVDSFDIDKPQTKSIVSLLESLKLTSKKVLILTEAKNENVIKSGRNIPTVTIMTAQDANIYEVLHADFVLVESKAFDVLKNRITD